MTKTEAVVFRTPEEIDIKAFTTFGINVKPNTENPIGYFGTGLKYAVAVLCRLRTPVSVYIGEREYEFYTQPDTFRGKEFHFIRMRERKNALARWRSKQLPITTEFGRNWERWQAYREIASNTIDEQGFINLITYSELHEKILSDKKHRKGTIIVVFGEEFANVHKNRDNIFLPDAITTYKGDSRVQILKRPSKHIYYRGLRVRDLPKPSIFTYNILNNVALTEDRTARWDWAVDAEIINLIVQSEDRGIIHAAVSAPDNKYEATLNFGDAYYAPSSTFSSVIADRHRRKMWVSERAFAYYQRYQPSPQEPTILDDLIQAIQDDDYQFIRDHKVEILEALRSI